MKSSVIAINMTKDSRQFYSYDNASPTVDPLVSSPYQQPPILPTTMEASFESISWTNAVVVAAASFLFSAPSGTVGNHHQKDGQRSVCRCELLPKRRTRHFIPSAQPDRHFYFWSYLTSSYYLCLTSITIWPSSRL